MVLLDLNSWWADKVVFEQIYWLFAVPSTVVFAGMLLMTFIGGDVDGDLGDADADVEGDGGTGFQFFTIKNLVSFFTIFGWVGIGCIDKGFSSTTTLIVSVACGLIMMLVMASIFFAMSKLVEDGTMKMKNAIGRIGEVYMIIPKGKEGFGKVQINIQGALREMDAMTADNEELTVGKIVKVLEVIDEHILLVTDNKNSN